MLDRSLRKLPDSRADHWKPWLMTIESDVCNRRQRVRDQGGLARGFLTLGYFTFEASQPFLFWFVLAPHRQR